MHKKACRAAGCTAPLHLAELCATHYNEHEERARLRDTAVSTLHSGLIDGDMVGDESLRHGLDALCRKWQTACFVVQMEQGTAPMPLDEADFAVEWCITLAEDIVKAQRQLSNGMPAAQLHLPNHDWVWERFRNLEAGLRSNGTPRSIG